MSYYGEIPNHMMEALVAYRDNHVPVGGFLEAVISNDFMEACGRADSTNSLILPVYASWFYNEAPSPCHGSREAYARWIDQGVAA